MNIKDIIQQKILVIDGAMGTFLQRESLSVADWGGEAFFGCSENLVFTRPDIVTKVHESYLEVGADVVETNTFGATSIVLDDYGLADKVREVNLKAVELAKAAVAKFSTPEKPRFVAGICGPTTKSLAVTGGITFDEMSDAYYEQCLALVEGGVDYILLETAMDSLNLKAAYVGAKKAFDKHQKELPVAISVTIEQSGGMLSGQGIKALYASFQHINPLYIGMNCALGPELMAAHLEVLASISKFPVAIVPNAGIPDSYGKYPLTPESFAKEIEIFVKKDLLNIVGGCCGTLPEHIKAVSNLVSDKAPRLIPESIPVLLSGIEPLVLKDAPEKPYFVGERANVIGSRAFKNLIMDEKFEEAAEIARKQIRAGADIVDICVSNPDRDDISDMKNLLAYATKIVKVPFMVDAQDPKVVEVAFKMIQGKGILNSVNLENGGEKLKELIPLVKLYGAAVVVGCIKEEMAITAAEKLAYAKEAYNILTKEYGLKDEDLVFDPLVFPCGTGDEKYMGSAAATIEGVRLIKQEFPRSKTILGVSNVSFGLPLAGREVMNKRFVKLAYDAGLDMAIVNSEKLDTLDVTEEEAALCDDLLFNRTEKGDPIEKFVSFFRDKQVVKKASVDELKSSPVEKRLEYNLVEGTKENLLENLDEARDKMLPIELVNGPLMAGMEQVGRLFNCNDLIVAEVLRSAEVMKAAVTYLEQFMDAKDVNKKGLLLLATVKGDVHDIGKNLVDIILSNNGYQVVDLGIKCDVDDLIEGCKKYNPDIIGLSGLLVKSTEEMVKVVKKLQESGYKTPVMLGGAALTERFVATKVASEYDGDVFYCRDAMSGLTVINHMGDEKWRSEYKNKQIELRQSVSEVVVKKRVVIPSYNKGQAKSGIKAPSLKEIIYKPEITKVWEYLDEQRLYAGHMGLKGNITKLIAQGDETALKLRHDIEAFKEKVVEEDLIKAKAVYRFYNVKTEGDDILVLDDEGKAEISRFTFPRQDEKNGECLADYIGETEISSLAMFVVSCGKGVEKWLSKYKKNGEYLNSLALYALSVESAEAFACMLHNKIRKEWGIGKDDGFRVSFGYSACPNLEDQEKMWGLLKPDQKIDVTLTENYLMNPEASVSALVFSG